MKPEFEFDWAMTRSIVDAVENHGGVAHRSMQFAEAQMMIASHLLPLVGRYSTSDSFTVLDIGCGDGGIAHAIASRWPNAIVVGVDDDEPSIDAANARPPLTNLSFRRANAAGLVGTYDVVVCSEVYEHSVDPEGLIRLCASLVAPGGLLSFSTPSGWMMRVPRLAVIGLAVTNPAEYKLRRNPERRWQEALTRHPGSRRGTIQRQLRAVGLEPISRTSSTVCIEPSWPTGLTVLSRRRENSWLLWLARRLGRGDSVREAQKAFHLFVLAEAVMNLFGLRAVEVHLFVCAVKPHVSGGSQ